MTRPVTRFACGRVSLCVCLLAATALGQNQEAPSMQSTPAVSPQVHETAEGCRVESFELPSPSMNRAIRVAVMLPPDHAGRGELPVLYALHGRGAPYDTFHHMAPLRARLADEPMIVVCFDGDEAGAYLDATQKPDSQFTTFFFEELLPFIDQRYPSNGVRGVTGFSMGGFGAVHYMLTRPDAFASVSSLSGALTILGEDGRPHRMFEPLLGPYDEHREAYEKLSLVHRIQQYMAAGGELPPMLLHCGSDDRLLAGNRQFVDVLAEQNRQLRSRLAEAHPDLDDRALDNLWAQHRLNYTYQESPGGHNWPFWRDAAADVIDFHHRTFQAQSRSRD